MPINHLYKPFPRYHILAIITLILLSGLKSLSARDPENNDSVRFQFYNSQLFPYSPDQNVRVNENNLKAGLLYDADNGKIVWQKDAEGIFPIASLTKMMVALLTVEDIRAGKVAWDNEVKWTREYVTRHNKKLIKNYSTASYTLYDLFKNAMIASNNEASEQIGRYLGEGNLGAFIQRMNHKAKQLGMYNTYYSNPTGLPATTKFMDNTSSPTDLLLLALEMLKYNEIMEVTGMGYASISHGRSTSLIRNHNHLTIDFKGEVDGMKTGYTKRAGFCLVATSNKNGHRLISVVLGSNGPQLRNETVKGMFNDYYVSLGLARLGPYSPQYSKQIAVNTYTDEDRLEEEKEGTENAAAEAATTPDNNVSEQPVAKPVVVNRKPMPVKEKGKFIYHTIQPGDTLYTIAQRYRGITVQMLKSANNISNVRALKPGMKIKVPTISG